MLSSTPLTTVDAKGLKTKYSKMVAIVKLKTNQPHNKTKAFFQRGDIKSLLFMSWLLFGSKID
jgi:hypothetical protein